jgi:hypothetical protein
MIAMALGIVLAIALLLFTVSPPSFNFACPVHPQVESLTFVIRADRLSIGN